MNKEQFGKIVLGWMLLTSANNGVKEFEEIGIKETFANYSTYLEYLLFLTRKILGARYDLNDTKLIVEATIEGVFDYMDGLPKEQKGEVKTLFKEMYKETESFLNEICNDIGSEQGLKELTTSFLNDCGVEKDMFSHMHAFALFSGFIIHHTSDILNDSIIII